VVDGNLQAGADQRDRDRDGQDPPPAAARGTRSGDDDTAEP
jgi:hypothetical protein